MVAFAALRVPFLSLPLDRDEGGYAYIAWRMLEGEAPYRAVFDQKPPGIYVAYLGAFALFGRSTGALHVFMHLWSAGSAVLLFFWLRRLSGDLTAAFGVLVFAVASVDSALGASAANTEIFMLLPMVASLLCLECGMAERRARWWLGCGALTAGACCFKQVAATHALFVVLVAAASLPPGAAAERLREALRRCGWIAVGALGLLAPVVAALVAAGAWERDIVKCCGRS